MNDEPESDDIRRAREALSALPAPAAADPAFRARMRREFAAGTLAPAADPAPLRAEPLGGPERIVPLPRSRRARPLVWGWAVAAAAAVAIIVPVLNRGPAWSVVSVTGAGSIVVDDRPVRTSDRASLAALLVPGARVHVPGDGMLAIASKGMLAIQMAGGTEAVVPRVPGRWFGREVDGTIAAGEWRITTGAGFPGSRFAISTPVAHVMVTGTTLAVICAPEGTCVCVYEGHVLVGRGPSDMATVLAGRRRFVYADSSHASLNDAMLPPERPALGDFCEWMRPIVRRPR